MFKKLKELNLFTKFIVEYMSQILYIKNVQNWNDFISYLGTIANNNADDAELHLKIREESIKEMDEDTHDLFLYSFKLNFEGKMEI